MPLQFVPFYERVFSNPDGAVLVRLIASKLLVNPRMSISAEPQPTLWLPLLDCPYQALNAVLAGIRKVFFVLDDLTHFPDEGKIVSYHSI